MRPKLAVRSRLRELSLAAICAAALAASGACSDDEDTAPGVIGPKGTIRLSILSVEATNGASVPGDTGGDLSLACDARVNVQVELDNWLLRPPQACAGAQQCGWLVLRIDPEGLVERSAACIELDDGGDSCRRAALSAYVAPLTGSHTFRVELRHSDGTAVLAEGGVLSDEVSVGLLAAPDCQASDAAAPDAADGSEGGTAPPDSSTGADAADAADAPAEAAIDSPADVAGDVSDASDEPD